jgi:hypothetical protein
MTDNSIAGTRNIGRFFRRLYRLLANRKNENFSWIWGLHLIFSGKRVTLIALTMTGGNNHGCN